MNEERERATESLWMKLVEAIRGGDQEEADRLAAETERACLLRRKQALREKWAPACAGRRKADDDG